MGTSGPYPDAAGCVNGFDLQCYDSKELYVKNLQKKGFNLSENALGEENLTSDELMKIIVRDKVFVAVFKLPNLKRTNIKKQAQVSISDEMLRVFFPTSYSASAMGGSGMGGHTAPYLPVTLWFPRNNFQSNLAEASWYGDVKELHIKLPTNENPNLSAGLDQDLLDEVF